MKQKTKKEEEQTAAKFLVHLFSKVKAEKAEREKEQQEERYLKHYVIKIEGRVSGSRWVVCWLTHAGPQVGRQEGTTKVLLTHRVMKREWRRFVLVRPVRLL